MSDNVIANSWQLIAESRQHKIQQLVMTLCEGIQRVEALHNISFSGWLHEAKCVVLLNQTDQPST